MSEFENTDFDAEFAALAKKDSEKQHAEEEYNDTGSYILSELAKMGWHYLREDNDRTIAFTEVHFMLAAEDLHQRYFEKTGEDIAVQTIVELCGDHLHDIVGQIVEYTASVEDFYIDKIIKLYNKSKEPSRRSQVEYEKLHLFAQMIAVHDMSPSDELVRCLNVLVPGDMLSTNDEDVQTMCDIVALEAEAKIRHNAGRNNDLHDTAEQIMASADLEIGESERHILIAKMIQLGDTDFDNMAEHEAAFYALTRSYRVPMNVATRLVPLFLQNAL